MRKLALALAAVAALFMTAPAGAAITVRNYTVTGSGTGTFSLNLDTSTSAYSLLSLDLTFGDTSFATADAAILDLGGGNLQIGGAAGGGAQPVLLAGTNDFWFQFADIGLFSGGVIFTQNHGQTQGSGTLYIFSTPAAVPEPATWTMMLLGFGAVGFAMRRRRRVALA
jgi:hypothetical protein